MPVKTSTRSYQFIAVTLSGLVLFAGAKITRSQESTAKKIDQFSDINAEDAMAHLDRFAIEIKSHTESRGVIVASNTTGGSFPRGAFLRLANGYRDYLIKSRGVDAARISVVEGERKRELGFELWITPANELSTISEEASAAGPSSPELFDQLAIGPEPQCVGQLPIELYKLEDGLRILSDALQHNSRAKAWIVVHPQPRDTRATAQRLIDQSRQLLNKTGVRAERILTAVGSSRSSACGQVNLWIVPANSAKADEAGYYSQLISEAESSNYTVRRVEFVGNKHIRDNVLRRQFVQGEGDVFSRRLLNQSLKNFSGLGLVYPVSLNDIEVQLDRETKLMDMTVYFRERRRRR